MTMNRSRAGWAMMTLATSLLPLLANAEDGPIAVGAAEQAPSAAPADAAAPAEPVAALDTIPVNTPDAAAPAAGAPKVKNRAVEEVVVTAQKREEKLQDVPISIQAFSGDALSARGLSNSTDLGQAVPSLQFTNAVGFTLIFMRGIGTDNFIPSADPSIATYIDGIYVPQGQGTVQSLGNVQRVEVLKGPQGTLFGRNATGGAVSIVTKEPGDVVEASAEGELGRFNERTGKFSVAGPVTDWLSASAAGLIARSDSLYANDNYQLQNDLQRALRLRLNFHPTENLSLSLTAFNTTQASASTVTGENTSPSLVGRLAGIQPAKDDYQTDSDFVGKVNSTQRIDYATLNWKLPWLDMKLLGSDQDVHIGYASVDFDGSQLPIAGFDSTNEFTRLKTGEVQFLSNKDTPWSTKLQWVGGLYYLRSSAGFDPAHLRVAPQGFDSILKILNLQGQPLTQGLQDLLNVLPAGNTPLQDGGISAQFAGVLETKSYSGYAQGTYFINDFVDVTLGGRYQTEERYLSKSSTSLANLTGNTGATTLLAFGLPSATARNFSPKAEISLHPRENALLYASYTAGYKSGTFNVVNIYTPPNYIVPEKVTTYELGAKVDFLDGRLRINGALFDNEIKNLQSGFVSLLTGGAVRFLTAGSARTRGFEADGTFVPLPDLDPGLALTGNFAYVDAKYTSFKNGSGFDPTTGLYSGNLDFSGNEIVRSPKLSGGIGAVQTIETENGAYELGTDVYYNSGFYYDAYNTVKESPYAILNARAGYFYNPWKLRVTAFGKNILDRRYHFQQFQTDFGITKTLAAPATYGLRLGWEF